MSGLPRILKRPFGITGPIQGPPYRVPRTAPFRGGEIAWSIAIFKPAAPLCMGTVPAAGTVRHVIPAGGVCPNDRGEDKIRWISHRSDLGRGGSAGKTAQAAHGFRGNPAEC
jgi:hypothetical protein